MEPSEIPSVMVEVAARALYLRQAAIGESQADRARHWEHNAREVLAAALSVCEAREEWRHVQPSESGRREDDLVGAWRFDAAPYVRDPALIERRLTLILPTTPAEPVPDGEAT